MVIIIDSREQRPLKFIHPYITETRVEKLDVGDYGVEFTDGYRPPFYFDRKSVVDLFGTMTNGYQRFKECIKRAQETNVQLFVIVEAPMTEVLKGSEYSKVNGISVVMKLFTLWVKYGVQTVFVSDRREMSEYITQFFIAVGKHHVRSKKDNQTTQQTCR